MRSSALQLLCRSAEPLTVASIAAFRSGLLKAAAPVVLKSLSTSSSSSWRFGFSSSSAASQAAAEDTAAAKAAAEQQQQQQGAEQQQGGEQQGEDAAAQMSGEELLQAFKEAQEALEAEKKKADDMKDRLLRTLADMENLRERTARTAAETKQFAVQSLVKNLLEVADNLERAAASVPPEDVHTDSDIDRERALKLLRSLRDGVLMTDTVLMKVLAKEGVSRYDPHGEKFDPNMHNALFEVPDATKEPGTVAVVVKRGYVLNERIVRAAEVGVTRALD